MIRVFISRNQKESSTFKKQLEAKGIKVLGKSLVTIAPQEVEDIPVTDWIFFYSKNGVRYFFKSLAKLGKELSKDCQIAVIGAGTAQELRVAGFEPDFTGTGDPQTTARSFLAIAQGQTVLFPQAAQSRQSVQQQLGSHIQAIPLVVYHNEPLEHFEVPYSNLLVFTSPMNTKAYFRRYQLQPGQKVLAIGKTTAAALRTILGLEVPVASAPSEAGLAQAALAILGIE